MKDYLISKRLKELLGTNQSFDSDTNRLLFDEYVIDRAKNIPLDESEARTLLILGNEHIIYFVLRKQFGIYGAYNDFEEFAEGKIGLVEAVDGYNNDSGIKFVTYAYQVIAHRIYKYYNRLNNLSNIIDKQKVSLNDYIYNEYNDKKEICLEDVLMADDDFIRDFKEKDLLLYIKKNIIYLTENEAFSIVNFFGLFGKSSLMQIEIAKILGVPQCSISQQISRGIRKLRVLTLDETLLDNNDLKLKQNLLRRGPQNDLFNKR